MFTSTEDLAFSADVWPVRRPGPSVRRLSSILLSACVLLLGTSSARGQAVGPEFRVNTFTTSLQYAPSVASDSVGNFVVVWSSASGQDGASTGIFGQRYGSGGTPFGAEFRVNSYTTNLQRRPFVAGRSDGSFVVAWESYLQDGSGSGVFGQRWGSDGAPLGTEFRVNTYTTGRQDDLQVAIASGGSFVVVWMSLNQDGSSYGIFGQRYGSTGAPLGSEFRVNSYTSSSQVLPSVASEPDGGFVVVWGSTPQDGSFLGIFGQRFGSTGTPLGGEFRVNTYTTGGQTAPSVASDSAGFVVAWQSYNPDASSYSVVGQRFGSTGALLGSEFRVNSHTTGAKGDPRAAIDSAGNVVVVWGGDMQDGSSHGIFGQRYDGTGTALGAEFHANTYTTNAQRSPSVATGLGGDFVVVWQSGGGQDGSSYGVFGQRFCPALYSVTIDVAGTTTICTTSTGGTATVTDEGGGFRTHQWAYRTSSLGAATLIPGEIGTSYLIDGVDFPAPGFYFLVCATSPECGLPAFSNEILVVVGDTSAPAVTPPPALTTSQTLCM